MARVSKNSLGKAVKWHSDAKRIEAVTTYLVLGKANLVGAAIGVPEGTIRQWRTQPWWDELVQQIQTESDQELDAKLAKRIDKALDLVNDRLENGDFQYDPRTGSFVRRPVGARDGWRIASEMVDKRWIIRKIPKDRGSQEAIGDILKNLAQEFATMAKKRMQVYAEVVVEETSGPEQIETKLPIRVQELPGNTDPIAQPEFTQPSTS